jgi:uncharacterized glyoxalase superfamily protein PhnB
MPVLPCKDVKAAMAFYTEQLGFEMANSFADDQDHWYFAIAQLGTITIGLAHVKEFTPHANWVAYLYIDDARGYLEALASRGVTPDHPLQETFYGMLEFDVTDSEGHKIAFGQDTAPTKRGPGL